MLNMQTASIQNKKVDQRQLLPLNLPSVVSAVQQLAEADTENRGAVFTRREVVDFILDLIGYVPSPTLYTTRLLEPSFGQGDFLIPAIERLMIAINKYHKVATLDFEILKKSVRAVELHYDSFKGTKAKLKEILLDNGFNPVQAESLLDVWLIQGDFLLTDFEHPFTHIVGNPPYIRQEMIPAALIAEYRRRYETIYDRADIYVPFIEYSLKLLDLHGVLGFICADRWMKNRYGSRLRNLVTGQFHLRAYIDMFGTPAFLSDVIAYPAITIIANEPAGPTYVARRPEITASTLNQLAEFLTTENYAKSEGVSTIANIPHGDKPWTLDDSDSLELVRRLERDFPLLEETGCKVGIGVATGADSVFIAPFDSLDVESDRKLPLAMTKDIQSGQVVWRGYGVINPFGADGKLVPLSQYPRLRAYLEFHAPTIKKRHVSKKNPTNWYRTIDRIYPALMNKPKLLIPDIKGYAHIVYEEGNFYPHHNLYYIVSEKWDLQALRAVLLSGIARLFIETYSTRMHGGFLRFQAQYLRRIRLPLWDTVPNNLRQLLRKAAADNDSTMRDEAVRALYNLSPKECVIIKA